MRAWLRGRRQDRCRATLWLQGLGGGSPAARGDGAARGAMGTPTDQYARSKQPPRATPVGG
eukprot:6305333-Pyramimonas_sp.AAC.1